MLGSQKVKFCLLLPLFRIAFEKREKRDLQEKKKKIHDEEFYRSFFFFSLSFSNIWELEKKILIM